MTDDDGHDFRSDDSEEKKNLSESQSEKTENLSKHYEAWNLSVQNSARGADY